MPTAIQGIIGLATIPTPYSGNDTGEMAMRATRISFATFTLGLVLTSGITFAGDNDTDAPNGAERVADASPEAQLRSKLDQSVSLNFQDAPLEEVMRQIGEEHDLTIYLARGVLEEAGIDVAQPIHARYEGVTLRSALKFILRDLDLAYDLDSSVLIITTPDEAETRLRTKVYAVGDLVSKSQGITSNSSASALAHLQGDLDQLVELVRGLVHVDSWDEVGGPGSLGRLPPDVLVVSQTREIHGEVERLLDALRSVPSVQSQLENPNEIEPLIVGATDHGEKWRQLLKAKKNIQYFDMPLNEVAMDLVAKLDLPIHLDKIVLEDAGIDVRQPVSVNFRGVPLGQAIQLMLRDLDMTYVIDSGVLLFTTCEGAEDMLQIGIYPIADLARVQSDDGEVIGFDFDSLAETILTTVRPETWDVSGGPGSIRVFYPSAALVFTQTQEVHEDVADLLSQLRRSRKASARQGGMEPPPMDEVVTRTYYLVGGDNVLSETDRESLAQIVYRVVEPNSWVLSGENSRFVTFLQGRIVVHHRREVQKSVESLLNRLGVTSSPHFCGSRGGRF